MAVAGKIVPNLPGVFNILMPGDLDPGRVPEIHAIEWTLTL
jgi:hypothetical protein